uniref:Gamma carbonic anhydrase-like 1, mitochondrial n=1 Tax=Salix viminalis TaxID=40686 RepID=A0A6N2LBR5_SALVM
MATTLARIAENTTTAFSLKRHFGTEAVAAATASTKSITPSADRVKWDYRGQRKIIPLGQWLPKIAVDAYVAPNVVLAGQVTVYDGASVWNGAVLRGDLNKITVGFCSNVQERCVLHAAWNSPTGLPAETSIERYVTIGAYSLLRSCTIEPECITRQHSILMEGSLVETHSILRLVSKVCQETLTHEETLEIPKLAVAINDLSKTYFTEFLPYSTVYLEVEKLKNKLGIYV